MRDLLIETQDLAKSYADTKAVDGIDLHIEAGEIFGLLGPNGAGKTTTVLMLLGLTEPDRGVVKVCGLDPIRHPLAVKRQVGYLPDTVGFYERLTGRENLRFTAHLNEVPAAEIDDGIDRALAQVGLADAADRPVAGYSRGMRNRLGVADVLIKDPRVVILDEPLVGIDPEGVTEMQRLITRLAREEGRAVLLTSHLLDQVQRLCDRMAIFVEGRILAEGTAADLAAAHGQGLSVFEVVTGESGPHLPDALGDLMDAHAGELEEVGRNRWRVGLPASVTARLLPTLVERGVDVRELRDLGSDLGEIYHRFFRSYQEVEA